jgi:hypothetical protein
VVFTCLGSAIAAIGKEQNAIRPFVFCQMADPQIGAGEGSIMTYWRLKKQVKKINALEPACGFIIGNLANKPEFWHQRVLDAVLLGFDIPIHFVPGLDEVSSVAGLERFRKEYGQDYYQYIYNNYAFIALNAATLYSSTLSPIEYNKQWKWLESTLAEAVWANRSHIFLLIHKISLGQSGSNQNDRRLRGLINTYGVTAILSSGSIKSQEFLLGKASMVYTLGGMGYIRDQNDYGFRVFRVSADRVEQEFIRVESSFHFPYFKKGWLPQLLNPRVKEKIKALVMLGAFIFSWRMGRRKWGSNNRETGLSQNRIWRFIALLFIVFLLDALLHLGGLVTVLGRWAIGVHSEHYQNRIWIQVFILGTAGCGLLVGFWKMGIGKRNIIDIFPN